MKQIIDGIQLKKIFIKAAGFGAGLALVAITALAVSRWYANRPKSIPAWNRAKITAKYVDEYLYTGNPIVFEFRYVVENHTGRDYELPSANEIYKVPKKDKGLVKDPSLKWKGSTSIPAGQKINVGIQIEFENTDNTSELDKVLLASFTESRLSGMDGFVALDKLNRYEIRFPDSPGNNSETHQKKLNLFSTSC